MILLWLTTTCWCLAIIGLGRLARLMLGRSAVVAPLSLSAALGVAVAQSASLVWNFFAPVSAPFSGTLLLVGGAGLALPRHVGGQKLDVRHGLLLAAIAAVIVPWLTTRVHYQHDVGFYALPSVAWAQAHALPLGLANINPRMGFNSGWYLLDALVRRPFLPAGTLTSLAPAIAITLVMALGASSLLLRRPDATRRKTFAFATFALVLLLGSSTVVWGINSPLGDLPVLIAWVSLAFLLLPGDLREGSGESTMLVATAIAALAITAKLSAAPLALVPAILAIRTNLPGRVTRVAALLFVLIVLPWLVRGFWTSGCFLFPVPSTCVPRVWWSLPLQWVHAEAFNIVNWAKEPYWSDRGFVRPDWILAWLARSVRSLEVQVPVVVAIVAVAFGARLKEARTLLKSPELGVAMALQLTLIVARAPDMRFAMGPLWVCAFAFSWLRMREAPKAAFVSFLFVCLVILAPAALHGWRDQTRGLRHAGAPPALWLVPPQLDRNVPHYWADIDGGRVRVAAPTMRPAPACWGLAPPCSPGHPTGLRMRWSEDGARPTGFSREKASP